MKIGIIIAMDKEFVQLRTMLSHATTSTVGGKEFTVGEVGNNLCGAQCLTIDDAAIVLGNDLLAALGRNQVADVTTVTRLADGIEVSLDGFARPNLDIDGVGNQVCHHQVLGNQQVERAKCKEHFLGELGFGGEPVDVDEAAVLLCGVVEDVESLSYEYLQRVAHVQVDAELRPRLVVEAIV